MSHAQEIDGWVKTLVMQQTASDDGADAFIYPNTAATRSLSVTQSLPADRPLEIVNETAAFSLTEVEIDFPEYYESLLERDIRHRINEWLKAKKVTPGASVKAAEDDVPQRRMALSFDVNVAADYWSPKWRSPVFFTHIDTARNSFHPSYALSEVGVGVDTNINNVNGAPRLTIRMFLEEDGARVWSGFAGAPVRGASRSQIARSLAVILADRIGTTTNDEKISFEPTGAPTVKIVNHKIDTTSK